MSTKTKIRSIRLSEELEDLIQRQVGENFQQKFENLVTRCVWELPEKEAQLERIKQRIQDENERVNRIISLRIDLESRTNEAKRVLDQSIYQVNRGILLIQKLIDTEV